MTATTSVTVRPVTAKDLSDTQRARLIDTLTDSFMSYKAHTDLWTTDRAVTHALMTTTVNHTLDNSHPCWIAENDGEIVAGGLWGRPGVVWCEEEELPGLFAPVITLLPEDLQLFLNETMLPNQTAMNTSVGDPKTWWMCAIFAVHPAYHGRGVGSALLQGSLKDMTGTAALNTQSEENVKFYEKNGFTLRDTRTLTLPSGQPWIDRILTIDLTQRA